MLLRFLLALLIEFCLDQSKDPNHYTMAQCVIEPDPDIIGIGVSDVLHWNPLMVVFGADCEFQVRLSLYILSLGGPLLSWLFDSVEFTRSINSSLGLNGLALFLAAAISASRGTLALFDALCIFNMLALAGIAIQPRGSYMTREAGADGDELTRAQKTHAWAFGGFYFAAVIGSLSFFIYVFATAPSFGATQEGACNDSTVYVLFGFDIIATNDVFRWIFAGGMISLLAGVFFALLISSGIACCIGGDICRMTWTGGSADTDSGSGRRSSCRFPFHLIGHLFASSYFVAMLELMINRNTLGPGKNDWGFGQLLAVALLIGPLTEICSLLIGLVGKDEVYEMRRR